MPTLISAPIEGELRSTPFAHILVYMVDRHLTGALFLEDPTGARHAVRFEGGAPVKVRPGDDYALLGQLLIDAGVISEAALSGALSLQGLLGDALILGGHTDHETVEAVAAEQFLKRMVRLFDLPPETKYTYLDGHAELADWGGGPASVDPLALLWAGLREHAPASTLMERTLRRIESSPIKVHPRAALDRFGFTAGELAALVRIKEAPRPLADLEAARVAPPDTLRRLVYALLITRHLDFGQVTPPVGVARDTAPDAAESASAAGPASTAAASGVPSSGLSPSSLPLGRMRLRTVAHRVGAAAPDQPGEGEPGSSAPRPRR